MLALRSAPKSSNSNETLTGNCTPNILPCRIHYDGPIETSKRHWHAVKGEKEDKQTAYFRGRKLQGRLVQLPEGYEVASPTNRLVPAANRNSNMDDELPEEPVKILESQATFDSFVVWGHEIPPAADDTFVKGVDEWIKLAEAIHRESQQPEKTA
uniref:Ribonuclease H2 subunit C n=1 Tax=Talaromyces marneffei PM1 TaxID=1077442 RepID=A0A093V572_TALMA